MSDTGNDKPASAAERPVDTGSSALPDDGGDVAALLRQIDQELGSAPAAAVEATIEFGIASVEEMLLDLGEAGALIPVAVDVPSGSVLDAECEQTSPSPESSSQLTIKILFGEDDGAV